MIRRAFLRRMASAAMAGMLGLELVSRAPKGVAEPEMMTRMNYFTVGDRFPGRGRITAIDYKNSVITVDWL